jgi:hypothetical protein
MQDVDGMDPITPAQISISVWVAERSAAVGTHGASLAGRGRASKGGRHPIYNQ